MERLWRSLFLRSESIITASSFPIIIGSFLSQKIWISPFGLYPTPFVSAYWLLKKSSLTVISFFVRVPVLSERMTVVAPRVSTEDNCFTIAFFFARRWTPRASAIVMVAGRPSGTAATATEIVNSRLSMNAFP